MAKSKKQIISDIEDFMTKWGGDIDDWYVGIAAQPRERLFDDHAVDEHNDPWIFRTASSDGVARDIERHFLDKGATGGEGGGSADTKAVYAYKIGLYTLE